MKEKTKPLTVHIPPSLHKQVKLYCVENDIQIKHLVAEVLQGYFEDEVRVSAPKLRKKYVGRG